LGKQYAFNDFVIGATCVCAVILAIIISVFYIFCGGKKKRRPQMQMIAMADGTFQQIPMPGFYPPNTGQGIEMVENPEFPFQLNHNLDESISAQHMQQQPMQYPPSPVYKSAPKQKSRKTTNNVPLQPISATFNTSTIETPNRNSSNFEITPVPKKAKRKSHLAVSTMPPSITKELALSSNNLNLGNSANTNYPANIQLIANQTETGSRKSLVVRSSLLSHPSFNFTYLTLTLLQN